MKELKGTKTLENLMAAFAGESMATNKYAYYASRAKKDGYNQIAAIFEETSGNEREHAKMWYKLIMGGIGTTAENLALAAQGENDEWTDMYPTFAKVARRRASRRSPSCLKRSPPSKRSTRRAIASLSRTSRRAECSSKTARCTGSA